MTAPANDALAHAHAGLVGRDDIQFTLPAYTQPQPPEWLKAVAHFFPHLQQAHRLVRVDRGRGDRARRSLLSDQDYGPTLLAWRPTPKPAAPDAAPEEWRPTAAVARKLLEESDALAAAGDYAQAVHLLLLRSIQDIDERRPKLVRPTLTSREISRLPDLPSAARNAFVGIAQTWSVRCSPAIPSARTNSRRPARNMRTSRSRKPWRIGAMR